ncbi:ABC transporter transmembrane domain-containing protein, partial [Candidatus Pelagibacter sp.]|nr:ABC transporter transmembrane domain-containing protein [Candidatus Pelagibacter sp.]
MISDFQILKRLYNDYTKKYVKKILLSVFFTLLLAGSTSSVAYLLDPAIKQLFIEQKKNLILIIPGLIIFAFIIKGASLYIAKVIMIGVSAEVTKDIQVDTFNSILNADTKLIENKHSGKFISNLSNDVAMITNLVSTVILNFFKDSLTLIGLLSVMFYQNWKLTLFAIIMIPVASLAAKSLGKRIGKVTQQQMKRAGLLNSYLIEILKNHKLAKIFQKESFEENRANKLIEAVKETSKKINIVFVRASPIMEILTGIMIAVLIYLSA